MDILSFGRSLANSLEEAKESVADAIQSAAAFPTSWAVKKMAASKSRELHAADARKSSNPKMVEFDQQRERKSILGELSTESITAIQPCIADAKAQRRRERLDLVSRAIVACPQHAQEAARLREDMDKVENMRCAKHVYLSEDSGLPDAPLGFKKATLENLAEMGLVPTDLQRSGSKFKAAVYMKDPSVWGEGSHPAAVIAFRGSTPEEEDWDNNFSQGINRESAYYRRAVTVGNLLGQNNASVHIVGHSLGGGLASAAQGGSGLTASTYNSAGLHPATVARYSNDRTRSAAEPDKIKAIRVKGEVLTSMQENDWTTRALMSDAVGKKRDLEPAVSSPEFSTLREKKLADQKDQYRDYLHGMDVVIDSMEKQKKADEDALKNCLESSL